MKEHLMMLALVVIGILLAFVANSYFGLEDKLSSSAVTNAAS